MVLAFSGVGISSVQSLSHVRLFATLWISAHQASLSITNSRSLLKLMSIESVVPSGHLILYCPLLLLPPIPPSTRVFSNESTLRIRRPKYWSFSFSISPSNEYPGLISFRSWHELGLLLCRKIYNPTKEELVLRYSSSFILGIFLLEYNCFIIFVSFSSTMKWISHMYTTSSPSWISPLLPNATSLGHHIALSRAPCAYSSFPLAIYFTHGSSCVSPNLPVCLTLLFPPCSHVHGFHLPVYFPSLLILVISCITAKKYLLSTHHRPPAVIGAGDTVVHRQTRFLLPCG